MRRAAQGHGHGRGTAGRARSASSQADARRRAVAYTPSGCVVAWRRLTPTPRVCPRTASVASRERQGSQEGPSSRRAAGREPPTHPPYDEVILVLPRQRPILVQERPCWLVRVVAVPAHVLGGGSKVLHAVAVHQHEANEPLVVVLVLNLQHGSEGRKGGREGDGGQGSQRGAPPEAWSPAAAAQTAPRQTFPGPLAVHERGG